MKECEVCGEMETEQRPGVWFIHGVWLCSDSCLAAWDEEQSK